MNNTRLTLRAALAGYRLEDFVRQEEARGVALDRGSDFERALALVLVQRGLTRNYYGAPVYRPSTDWREGQCARRVCDQ
jgi:hypothetical protein